MADATIDEPLEDPCRIQMRIVAGSRQLEEVLRQLIAGVLVEVTIGWSPYGEANVRPPAPLLPRRYASCASRP